MTTKDEALRAARDALWNSGEASGSARTRAALTAIEAALSAEGEGRPAFYIAWNRTKTEGVAFSDMLEAHSAFTGKPNGFGIATLAEAFFEAYGEDGEIAADIEPYYAAPPAPAADLAALRAENERLRKALEPFAAAAGIKLCGEWRDDERFSQTDVGAYLTFGHLRRARATLNEGGEDA